MLNLPYFDYSRANLQERRKRLAFLESIVETGMLNDETINALDIKNEIKTVKESLNSVITSTQTSKQDSINMMRGFFSNNNPELDEILENTDFTQYGKNGIPLKYSREQFLNDLSCILDNASQDQKDVIFKKLGIIPAKTTENRILGYDGIIDLTKLSQNGIEGEVLKIANRFIKENAVKTGDTKLDEALNSLIKGMPEFINIIGKKQHSSHDYSLDIHILSTLKEALSDFLCYRRTGL